MAGQATGPLRGSTDLAGQRAAFGVPIDCLASAAGTGGPSAAEVASRDAEQERQRAECGTPGLVRLDDLGDQRASRDDDPGRSGRPLPCSLASGVAVQALEIA